MNAAATDRDVAAELAAEALDATDRPALRAQVRADREAVLAGAQPVTPAVLAGLVVFGRPWFDEVVAASAGDVDEAVHFLRATDSWAHRDLTESLLTAQIADYRRRH